MGNPNQIYTRDMKDGRIPTPTSTPDKYFIIDDGSTVAGLAAGPVFVTTAGIPSAVAGYAVGCELLDYTTGVWYQNTGTGTSCSFTARGTNFSAAAQSILLKDNTAAALNILEAANSYLKFDTTNSSELITTGVNLIAATSKTIDTTTADTLKSAGIIVPTNIVIPFTCMPHASNLTRTLFYAQTDAWTVTGVGVVMDLIDDTAITASICKCTGNNVAAAATTPLHTGTFNMQTTAGTPQVGTLTATGADLALAATNKIGIVFSGALDVGICSGWIKMKRT